MKFTYKLTSVYSSPQLSTLIGDSWDSFLSFSTHSTIVRLTLVGYSIFSFGSVLVLTQLPFSISLTWLSFSLLGESWHLVQHLFYYLENSPVHFRCNSCWLHCLGRVWKSDAIILPPQKQGGAWGRGIQTL